MKKNPITPYYIVQSIGICLLLFLSSTNLIAQDDDWYRASTTTPPTNIAQDIYTNGNVGIGVLAPTSTLQVFGTDVWLEDNNFRSGHGNIVTGSMVSGGLGADNHTFNSHSSFNIGNANFIDACTGTVGLGGQHFIEGSEFSVALGEENQIFGGHGSVAIGGHNIVKDPYTIAIGEGVVNSITQSLMVGFGGTTNLYVDKKFVGVGTTSPQEMLHVDGVIRASSLAGGGNVCADANGNLILSGACGGSGSADNLGNHTATQPLDMNCFDMVHVNNMEFCNGIYFDQSNPNEMVIQNGAVGIGIPPSAVGSTGGVPTMLAVAGNMWLNGIWYGSDKRYKQNINQLRSSLDAIGQIKGYQYEFRTDEFPELNFQEGKTIGFIAQELKEVFPELVEQGANGYYHVNYIGLVPVLTEAIKEQQSIIDQHLTETAELREELAELKAAVQSICNNGCGTMGSAPATPNTKPAYWEEVQLQQNAPNPFTNHTNIGYYLPQEVNGAALIVYDLQGKQLKKYDITQNGHGTVSIQANELQSGMYLYSLVIDGRASDTLKMILTD